MGATRTFSLGAVLSVLHRQMLCRTKGELAELVAFLKGRSVAPLVNPIVMEHLVQLSPSFRTRPELRHLIQEDATPPEHFANTAAVWAWLSQMERRYGLTVEVAR